MATATALRSREAVNLENHLRRDSQSWQNVGEKDWGFDFTACQVHNWELGRGILACVAALIPIPSSSSVQVRRKLQSWSRVVHDVSSIGTYLVLYLVYLKYSVAKLKRRIKRRETKGSDGRSSIKILNNLSSTPQVSPGISINLIHLLCW